MASPIEPQPKTETPVNSHNLVCCCHCHVLTARCVSRQMLSAVRPDATKAPPMMAPATKGLKKAAHPQAQTSPPTPDPTITAMNRSDRFPEDPIATRHGDQRVHVSGIGLRPGPSVALVARSATTIVSNRVTAPSTYVLGRLSTGAGAGL